MKNEWRISQSTHQTRHSIWSWRGGIHRPRPPPQGQTRWLWGDRGRPCSCACCLCSVPPGGKVRMYNRNTVGERVSTKAYHSTKQRFPSRMRRTENVPGPRIENWHPNESTKGTFNETLFSLLARRQVRLMHILSSVLLVLTLSFHRIFRMKSSICQWDRCYKISASWDYRLKPSFYSTCVWKGWQDVTHQTR